MYIQPTHTNVRLDFTNYFLDPLGLYFGVFDIMYFCRLQDINVKIFLLILVYLKTVNTGYNLKSNFEFSKNRNR